MLCKGRWPRAPEARRTVRSGAIGLSAESASVREPPMDERKTSFSDRFSERYRALTNTPESKRDRRRRLMRCLCILLLLPFGILAIEICKSFGWHGSTYGPIVTGIVIGIGTMAGSVAARWKEGQDECRSSRKDNASGESGRRDPVQKGSPAPLTADSSSWTGC